MLIPTPASGTAKLFVESFLDPRVPLRSLWWPRYQKTIDRVRSALDAGRPEDVFELIWTQRDNAISNAGQGLIRTTESAALRADLNALTLDIAANPSPECFDKHVARFEAWRSERWLSAVPSLLLARAFAAIHPDRYHTTVAAEKHDAVIAWFQSKTGFVVPDGTWAVKAAALVEHMDRWGALGEERHFRNLFPWFVYDQLRNDKSGAVPFQPGHTPRSPVTGEAVRTVEISKFSNRHIEIQNKLYEYLCKQGLRGKAGSERPTGTGGFADMLVLHDDGAFHLYEIKPAANAASAIRQAIGQLLEYAYWPGGLRPATMTVVSDAPLDDDAKAYLEELRVRFKLDLEYLTLGVS